MNISNKQSGTADKEWSFSLLRNVTQGFGIGGP